jgi:hypothetical protein
MSVFFLTSIDPDQPGVGFARKITGKSTHGIFDAKPLRKPVADQGNRKVFCEEVGERHGLFAVSDQHRTGQ